jgi:hypothetical protein
VVIPFPGFLLELAALVAPIATPILIRQAIRSRSRDRATVALVLAGIGVFLACLPPSWSMLGFAPLTYAALRVRRELPGRPGHAALWERVAVYSGVALVLYGVLPLLYFFSLVFFRR